MSRRFIPIGFGTLIVLVALYAWLIAAGAGPMPKGKSGLDMAEGPRIAHSHLPEPIRRYLDFAVLDPRPVREVRMYLEGKVILPGWDKAIAVSGWQVIGADRPRFHWQVAARVSPFLTARIIDAYDHGVGSIYSRVNRLVTVIDDKNIPQLNLTQLARWSGLAVMVPTVFTRADVFTWQSDGPNAAMAVVRDGKWAIRHRFVVNPDGSLAETISQDRWERYDGVYKRTASIMRRSDWTLVDGLRIPLSFTVTRIEPDGSKIEFWKGRFSQIEVIR